MTQSQLIQHICAPDRYIRTDKLSYQLKSQNFSLRDLVDLTFYHDKEVGLNASRLLEYILLKFPENYYEDIGYLIERVKDVTCIACKKPYAKILMHITSPEVPRKVRNKMKEISLEHVAELCFDWLVDPKMLVGIRVSASEALFNMRHRYPWIAEELSNQLEFIVRSATPALLAKSNYILSYLHPE